MIQTVHAPLTREQQVLVLECCERIRKLASRYSRNTSDFEDLYSIGLEEVCKVVARASGIDDPYGYLYRSAQNAMIDELKRRAHHQTVSLDAPLSSKPDFCLADILPSRLSQSFDRSSASCMALVQKALSRLSPREREVLHHRYGFDGCCGVLSHAYAEIGQALGMTRSGASSIATVAHRKLRADVQLCQAIGVEPELVQVTSEERRAALRVTYARELEAWNAGARSINRLARVTGLPRSTAAKHLAQMCEAGLIQRNEVSA